MVDGGGCEDVAVRARRRSAESRRPVLRRTRSPGVVRDTSHRETKGRFVGMADRTADVPLGHAALFGRLDAGKGVAGIEGGVAKDEISDAVVFLRAGPQYHFPAAATRTRILGGVRIVVNLDLLDGRR